VKTAYFIALAAILVSSATAAQEQTRYACTVDGRTVYSTAPCVRSGVVYYGPARSQSSDETPIPKIGPAPANLQYLSPRCASLSDAIRTGPARGLKYDAVSQLQRDYDQQCSENENEAYNQMRQERKNKQKQLTEANEAQSKDMERTQVQQQLCGESKRILLKKRARTDLTDGEKADLRRFEENYLSRCG